MTQILEEKIMSKIKTKSSTKHLYNNALVQ